MRIGHSLLKCVVFFGVPSPPDGEVRYGGTGFLASIDQDGETYGGVLFLGLYQSSWDGEPGKILAADRNLRGGARVPVGMGVVVPGMKLIDLLRDHPALKAQREDQLKKRDKERAATTDSAIPELPTKADNPQHREDFNRLLDAAVKGPKSDRKT